MHCKRCREIQGVSLDVCFIFNKGYLLVQAEITAGERTR